MRPSQVPSAKRSQAAQSKVSSDGKYNASNSLLLLSFTALSKQTEQTVIEMGFNLVLEEPTAGQERQRFIALTRGQVDQDHEN